MLFEEVELMKTINHPSMIRVHETYREDEKFHVVLELGDGGSVFDNMKTSIMLDLFEYIVMKTPVIYPHCPPMHQEPDAAVQS